MKSLIFFALLFCTLSLNAQSGLDPDDYRLRKNELYASYSPPFVSGTEIGLSLTYAILEGLIDASFGSVDDEKYHSFGTAHIGYNRHFGKRFSMGLEMQYNRWVVDGLTSGGEREYSYRVHVLQPQLRADFRYISKPKFQMYSGAAVGLMFGKSRSLDYDASGNVVEERISPWELNGDGVPFHFNLIGLRFGRKTAFFTEIGIGFNSLLRGGVSTRF